MQTIILRPLPQSDRLPSSKLPQSGANSGKGNSMKIRASILLQTPSAASRRSFCGAGFQACTESKPPAIAQRPAVISRRLDPIAQRLDGIARRQRGMTRSGRIAKTLPPPPKTPTPFGTNWPPLHPTTNSTAITYTHHPPRTLFSFRVPHLLIRISHPVPTFFSHPISHKIPPPPPSHPSKNSHLYRLPQPSHGQRTRCVPAPPFHSPIKSSHPLHKKKRLLPIQKMRRSRFVAQ
jgi:hypothetical protein